MSWSAAQYVNFEAERTRPVRDLAAAIPNTEVWRAIDLGCGPGNSTEVLAARYPDASISGLDNSPDMVAAARKRLPDLNSEKLAAAAGSRAPRRGAEWYYRLLKPLATRVDVWLTIYHHVLPGGSDAVIEWFKGSGLRPFLAPLDAADTEAYLTEYRAGIAEAYPTMPDGTVLLPFPRLFMVATR
jgi:trans-aconitate methyltransferase